MERVLSDQWTEAMAAAWSELWQVVVLGAFLSRVLSALTAFPSPILC